MFKVIHFCQSNQLTEEEFSDLHKAIDHAIQYDGYIEGICGYSGGHQQSTNDYISLNSNRLKPNWIVSYELSNGIGIPEIAQTGCMSLQEAIAFKRGLKIGLNFGDNNNDGVIKIIHYETKLEYQ